MHNLFESTELHKAVAEGDAERVKLLIVDGADVNARSFFETTPLMDACGFDKARIIDSLQVQKANHTNDEDEEAAAPTSERLLKLFDTKKMLADLDRKREYDDAPAEDNTEIPEILLKCGADVNTIDTSGHSALTKAVMAGRVDTARMLLEHGADFRSADTSGLTPLMLATTARKLETVKLLLEWGADPDYRTPQGSTTLIAAAEGGRVEIAALLMMLGQDVNTANVDGVTALQRAAAKQHEDMTAFLMDKGARVGFLEAVLLGDYDRAEALPVPEATARSAHWGQQALARATRWGRADLLRLLLKRGVRPSETAGKGNTLMQAVMRGDVTCARLLLEAGAAANGGQGRTDTPLAWAGKHGDAEMMNLLMTHGADVSAAHTMGMTALAGAVMFGQVKTARKLMESGADPNTKSIDDGMSLLTFATVRNNKEMVRLLLDFGANPKVEGAGNPLSMARNKPEIASLLRRAAGTDLHELAKEGKIAEVMARLEAGADIDARDEMERTVLMAALQGKQGATAQALIGRGADIHAANRFQHTVLHFAVVAGEADIVRLHIAQGANVMAGDAVGKSPLHVAAVNRKTEIASLLIEASAHVGTVEAALLGDLPLLINLLNNGADVNAPDGGGMTPLMAAAACGYEELITTLLSLRAEINLTDEDGKTALAWAVGCRRLEPVRLLLDAGADVNMAGIDQRVVRSFEKRAQSASAAVLSHFEGWEQSLGMSPLACAAILGDIECAQFLIARGADVNANSGFNGRTVLAWAVLTNKMEMTRLLLYNGADPCVNQDKFNLLQMAKQMGKNEEMIALLHAALQPPPAAAQ